MRDLTDEFKLSARSTPDVFVMLGRMVDRLKADRRVRFRGKKPTRAAVVNAALIYLDTLPPSQWEQAITIGFRRLEEILSEDDAAGVTQAEPPAGIPELKVADSKRVGLTVEDVSPEAASEKPASRRKRRG
jgi:hypothetical protein